ncbi:MAG: hypothetical protein HFE97_12600 [Oscillospiraceae bacterium]|nr:hypothetical protein [Oscillospiraceae bacterium]
MPRTIRPKEERIAEIEMKIEAHKETIKNLEAKKQAILSPRKRKARPTAKSVVDMAIKAGMKPAEIMEKLGLTTEEQA